MDYPDALDGISINDIPEVKKEFDPVPDGEYTVKLMEPTAVKTQKSNDPMIKYYVIIQDGPQAGRRVWSNWVFSPTGVWKPKKDFKAMKYEPVDGKPVLADLEGFLGIVKVKNKGKDESGRDNVDLLWLSPLV